MSPRQLVESARVILALSDEERINYIHRPKWITYPNSQRILMEMDQLLRLPQSNRMPSMALVSRTNNGKTEIAKRFAQKHPPDENFNGDHIIAPVIFVEAPPAPSEAGLYAQILSAVYEKTPSGSADTKRDRVIEVLSRIGLKVLVIDELHNLVSGSSKNQAIYLNTIKFLSNQLKISIIGCGTEQLLTAIATDGQIQNRFKPFVLPLWKANKDYQSLLSSFERTLPLQNESILAAPKLARKIHAMSEGTIGETAELIRCAAKYAIKHKVEKIDDKVLDECSYTMPSKRSDISKQA
jgi:Bacterial TniB protein